MSLRLRLTILYSALTGIILLVFGILLYFLVSDRLVSQIDDALRQTSYNIYSNAHVNSSGELDLTGLPNLDLMSIYVQVWDNNSKLVYSQPPNIGLIQPLDPSGFSSKQSVYHNSTEKKIP